MPLTSFPFFHKKNKGLVIDCGHEHTAITPVFKGITLRHASVKIESGGKDTWDRLGKLLGKQQSITDPYSFSAPQLARIAKEWAHQHCFYSLNYPSDLRICENLVDKKQSVSILDG